MSHIILAFFVIVDLFFLMQTIYNSKKKFYFGCFLLVSLIIYMLSSFMLHKPIEEIRRFNLLSDKVHIFGNKISKTTHTIKTDEGFIKVKMHSIKCIPSEDPRLEFIYINNRLYEQILYIKNCDTFKDIVIFE